MSEQEPWAPADRTVVELLRRQADRYGDRPLIACAGAERSFAGLAAAAARTAGALQRAGIGPGDRVALFIDNRIEFLDHFLGCAWLGAVAVPLNTALRGAGLEHQLRDSGARLLVGQGGITERLAAFPLPATLERIWLLDPEPAQVEVPVEPADTDGPAVPAAGVGPGTPVMVMYTSGTTGSAKGVVCPHAQLYWWGRNVAEQLEITAADVLYTCLPMFHINALGTVFQGLLTGARVEVGPRFSASQNWERLAASGATVTYLLGSMVTILAGRPAAAADAAHRVTRALAPSTPEAIGKLFVERFGIELVDSYGSTETNAVLAAALGAQRPGLIGPVRTGYQARVVDESDTPVPDGEAGELVLRADEPFAFASGYLGRPEQTVAAWRNLWFHTGDRVVRFPDGWYRFLDRMSDSIRRRGENISSFDVEQAVGAHPAVVQVAAYALPAEVGEDEVAVAVVPDPAAQLSEEAVVRWCEGRLPYFAVPRFVRFVAELPTTENGKVRKRALRDDGGAPCWDRTVAGVVVSRDR